MINYTETKAFLLLSKYFSSLKNTLANSTLDHKIVHGDLTYDYSRHNITNEGLALFEKILSELDFEKQKQAMFSGEAINATEKRSALHTLERAQQKTPFIVNGVDIAKVIEKELEHMREFSEKVRAGLLFGYTGKAIKNIINIGIGGSHLGPYMAYKALAYYKNQEGEKLTMRFVSNIDVSDIYEQTKDLNPEETLFIMVSKTFTTDETMTNAMYAKNWLLTKLIDDVAIEKHMIAVSCAHDKAMAFGIAKENIFTFGDYVGGRYSVWSSVGISLMISIGYTNFLQFLEGANNIDEHFMSSKPLSNIPVIMAMLSIWYGHFYKSQTHAILPYNNYLSELPKYLQQLVMESNGKSVQKNGKAVTYPTSPVIWGEVGTNGQHSFYQLLHQGTHAVPSDFIGFIEPLKIVGEHHKKLMANMWGQADALWLGKKREELEIENVSDELIPYKTFEGEKPSSVFIFSKLTPYTLGQLLAVYEHKTFVEGIFWNVNSFDQFGVELGKEMSKKRMTTL
jgi:glucose-6-phosphate isomerase